MVCFTTSSAFVDAVETRRCVDQNGANCCVRQGWVVLHALNAGTLPKQLEQYCVNPMVVRALDDLPSSGTIPAALGGLTALRELRLFGNQLSGECSRGTSVSLPYRVCTLSHFFFCSLEGIQKEIFVFQLPTSWATKGWLFAVSLATEDT